MLIIVLMMMMVMLVMPWVGGGSTVERKFNDGGDDPSVVPLHPPAIDPNNDVGNDHNDYLGDDDDLDYDGALLIISNDDFPAERISTDSRNLSTLRSSRSAELEC